MTPWLAGLSDLDDLVSMGALFHQSAQLPGNFVPDAFGAHVTEILDKGAVYRTEKGMIGGFKAPVPYDPNYIMAVELFWWSGDGRGRELLKAFEAWAEGADEIRMTTLATSGAASSLLARKNYRPMETSHVRVI